MKLRYKIKFLDYWHLSSGLSAGAKLDSTVIKDEDTLPYIPGKTIKGLIREMAELLEDEQMIKECFGEDGINQGKCYLSNASLLADTAKEIKKHHLQDKLYDTIASTKIEKNGIATTNSLREIEVVIPLTLEGYINDAPDQYKNKIKKSLMMIKRMGLNRNRGLGRCEVIIEEAKDA